MLFQVVRAIGSTIELPGEHTGVQLTNAATEATNQALVNLYSFGWDFLQGIVGIGIIVSIMIFVKLAFTIGRTNLPVERVIAIRQMMAVLGIIACLGALPLIMMLILAVMNSFR